MRLFIALTVPTDLKTIVTDWRHQFSALPVRWLPEHHFHVTIIPPWDEVDELPIVEALREIEGSMNPLSLRFDRVRLAPNQREPRLIWAEGPTPTELLRIKERLERTMEMPPDRRPFRLHLTLARFSPEQLMQFHDQHFSDTVSWSGIFNEFALIRSDLFPAGVEYTTLSTHHI